MKKHFVLTHMDRSRDRPETGSFYQGEYEIDLFPVKVSYWKDDCLTVPFRFDSEGAARDAVVEALAMNKGREAAA